MKISYDLIIDKKSHKKIIRQSKNIEQGKVVNNHMSRMMRALMIESGIKFTSNYSDMFERSELVRCKFAVKPLVDYKESLDKLLIIIETQFIAKEISYINEDENCMILIWL